jgi:hypothetical protein
MMHCLGRRADSSLDVREQSREFLLFQVDFFLLHSRAIVAAEGHMRERSSDRADSLKARTSIVSRRRTSRTFFLIVGSYFV